MRKVTTALMCSSLALGLLATAPAAADSWTWRDKGGRGPLAISSVKVGHWRAGGAPKLTVTFHRPLKPSLMGRKDFIVVDYEGNGKGRSEGWIYVYARGGRLESFEHNPSTGETYSSMGIERPTPRSLRVVPWNHQSGGYAFAAVSYSENAAAGCGGGCWDAAPNRGYLVHDWNPPAFVYFVAPEPYDRFWYDPEIPLRWRATDTGLSRVARTSVVWRDPHATGWKTLVTRKGGGREEASVRVVEGAHMLLQGVAEDGAGNTATSYASLLRIPWDDANESGPGAFTGAWTREENPDAARGSVNVGTGPAATFSFTDAGPIYCVVVRWPELEPSQARLQLDDGNAVMAGHDAGDAAARDLVCVRADSGGDQTATFTVLAGRAGVDGYWAGDDSDPTGQTATATHRYDHMGRAQLPGRASPRSLEEVLVRATVGER